MVAQTHTFEADATCVAEPGGHFPSYTSLPNVCELSNEITGTLHKNDNQQVNGMRVTSMMH